MYCALIKKVPITQCANLIKISSNQNTNFISLGGSDGFTQIVIANTSEGTGQEVALNKSQFTKTQTLDYHKKGIIILTWNDNYNKLTTCDSSGTSVVWKCKADGEWDKEMINVRGSSNVMDIKWSKQGNFICFTYADGNVTVGTIEGNLSWANETNKKVYLIEWSPDASNLLLAVKNANVIVLSSNGQEIGELELETSLKKIPIITMAWWTNLLSHNRSITLKKHLLLAFENGVVCLYDNDTDSEPIIIKTILSKVYKAEWTLTGDLFAICGILKDDSTISCVVFYTFEGEYIRTIKAPDPILSFSWISNDTQIALLTKGILYFALVKPQYKWCFFSDTLVYAYFNQEAHHTLVYWDIKKNKSKQIYVRNMLGLTACKDFCLVTIRRNKDSYFLILNNCQGSKIDERIVNIDPDLIEINGTHIAITNKHYIYIWQFRALESQSGNEDDGNYQGQDISVSLLKKRHMKETVFFIGDVPNVKSLYDSTLFIPNKMTKDTIVSISLSKEYLFAACTSGKIFKYNLAQLSSMETFNMSNTTFIKIGSSPKGKYLWGIDISNILTIWDTETMKSKTQCEKLKFDKKEVWNVLWSDEDNLNFALLEKNRLSIINNLSVENSFVCNGYLGEYSKMALTIVKIEDMMFKPWETVFKVYDIVIKIDTGIMKQLKEHMQDKIPIDDIYHFAKKESSSEVWKMVSEHSLNNLDFTNAEKAMVHNKDLVGLSFINKVKNIDDINMKQAEIAQYTQNYDNAEKIYNENDRKDLAIEMRIKLGQWDKVIDTMEANGLQQENHMKISYSNMGDQLMETRQYTKAEECYIKADNAEGLINLWFKNEEYDKAASYIDKIPPNSELLMFMGNEFETYGLCEEAVACYCKYGDDKRAIDTCVKMNKWNVAVELAEKNSIFQIDALVNKFGNILHDKNKKMDLFELYRKAHRHGDATEIILQLAEDFRIMKASPFLLKKIYVFAALEMLSLKAKQEIPIKQNNISQLPTAKDTMSLNNMMNSSEFISLSDKTLNNPWRGAEAFHFYMLCQLQLYRKQYRAAFKTSLRLVLYEKELNAKEVYRLIALSAFLNESYLECSKAISKLENMPNISTTEQLKYQQLAWSIFTIHEPITTNIKTFNCPTKSCGAEICEIDILCKSCGTNFPGCVMSGQSIFHNDYFKCKQCKHKSLKKEVMKHPLKHCPLCHIPLK